MKQFLQLLEMILGVNLNYAYQTIVAVIAHITLCKKNGHTVQILSIEDHWMTSLDENVNMAVNMCSGEYAWIFGDDDVLYPGLGYLLEYLAESTPEL